MATAIGRSSSEVQPLMALDWQPSLPRGAEELFSDSLRTQDLTGSSEAPPMCSAELVLYCGGMSAWYGMSYRVIG